MPDLAGGSGDALLGTVPGAGPPPRRLAACKGTVYRDGVSIPCRYYGEPAFDDKCPQCGAPMSKDTTQPQDSRAADQATTQQVAPTQGTMLNASATEAAQPGLLLVCEYCGLESENVTETLCSRCGMIREDVASAQAAQASAPTSYQPGGPLRAEDHPMNCVACGQPVVATESVCTECGYRVVEDSEIDWSEIVTPQILRESRYAVSLAMQGDDRSLKALANSFVWGESTKDVDPTELADAPPDWLPDHQHELWRDLVTEREITTPREAVAAFKQAALA